MAKARILIVDDEESTRELFAELLQRWGYEVDQTADGHGALKLAAETHPDVIISDLVMPKLDGLALVRALREEQPDTPVVIITGKGTIDAAVEAVREGVFDFVEKPLDPARLKVILQRALEKKETLHEMQVLRRRLGQVDAGVGLVGSSPPMRRAMELVEKVAPSKASVVITGQSGTGKEMVARAIHQLSPRREKPFIAINCSAIPASLIESEMFGHERGAFTGADQRRLGAWELADGGTLFLDEVGEIPIELQAKFLRVIEEERLQRAVILCGSGLIEAEHLPSELAAGGGESAYLKLPYGLPLREIEKEYILATLNRLQNNKAKTAQALGISEKTLYNKLYRYSGRGPRKDDDDDDHVVEVPEPGAVKITGIG